MAECQSNESVFLRGIQFAPARVTGVHALMISTSYWHLSARKQTTAFATQAIERTLQILERTLLLHLSDLDR